jgi:hypothetical protein
MYIPPPLASASRLRAPGGGRGIARRPHAPRRRGRTFAGRRRNARRSRARPPLPVMGLCWNAAGRGGRRAFARCLSPTCVVESKHVVDEETSRVALAVKPEAAAVLGPARGGHQTEGRATAPRPLSVRGSGARCDASRLPSEQSCMRLPPCRQHEHARGRSPSRQTLLGAALAQPTRAEPHARASRASLPPQTNPIAGVAGCLGNPTPPRATLLCPPRLSPVVLKRAAEDSGALRLHELQPTLGAV